MPMNARYRKMELPKKGASIRNGGDLDDEDGHAASVTDSKSPNL